MIGRAGNLGRRRAAAILILGGLFATTPSQAASPLTELLGTWGLRPVQPPAPAADFTLPALGGGRGSFAEHQGHWLLATFFATWCGPCKSEMPSLEKLHQASGGRELAVLGVAIDGSATEIAAFARNLGLTFPILLDENGRATAAYRAGSVPVTYLIDPAGRIVGVARGARDWTRIIPRLPALSGLPVGDPGPGYTAGAEVELPNDLVPPTGEVQLLAAAPEVGETFTIAVRVEWSGALGDYVLLPPTLHLPAGVRQLNTAATTNSRDGRAVVTYELQLAADQAGSFALDPVELRYAPHGAPEPLTTRITGPTLSVRPWTVAGMRPLSWVAVLGGAALGAGGLALGRGWRRRRAARQPPASDIDDFRSRFDAARRHLLDGDAERCVESLAALEDAMALDAEVHRAALLERVRYAGYRPSAAELEPWCKRLERHLTSLAEQRATAAVRTKPRSDR